MRSERADIVAVSDGEQQRETLVIMLDPDFAVTAIPTPSAPVGNLEPRAVVLSAGEARQSAEWCDGALQQALQRWPGAGLVLVDAPETVAAHVPRAVRASWNDPFSVPAAVAQVTALTADLSPAAALIQAVHGADMALRPSFESAQVLADLARALERHASSAIASHFLAEQLRELVDRLAWVDWFDEPPLPPEEAECGAAEARDLTRWLRSAVDARATRARCRGLDFDFRRVEPCVLPCSAAQLSILARALRAALLELPPGRIEVEADAGSLHCRHGALSAASQAFALDVVGSLLRRIDARLRRHEGQLTISVGEAA